MNEITLQPGVYSTGDSQRLVDILDRVWIKDHVAGDGTMFIVSGFANYNGGVRFFDTFRKHREQGGDIVAVFAGSPSLRMTSRQLVEELLDCGVEVYLVERRRHLHAKCYGTKSSAGESLVVTSGNFTGPGMAGNVEMSVLLGPDFSAASNFSWQQLFDSMLAQNWSLHQPVLANKKAPAWQLLYDEKGRNMIIDDDMKEVTMIVRLGHADTARINAGPGDVAAKGSQYFWLSKDCYSFFPPLTTRNERGTKATYSCVVAMNYIDLGTKAESRVTFEVGNNQDFRLGTGPLRYTRAAKEGDLAAISRTGAASYDLRLFRQEDERHAVLLPYAKHAVGSQGKLYGYMLNSDFFAVI